MTSPPQNTTVGAAVTRALEDVRRRGIEDVRRQVARKINGHYSDWVATLASLDQADSPQSISHALGGLRAIERLADGLGVPLADDQRPHARPENA